MEEAWSIIKWVWAATLFAYLIVQVVATLRLTGERRRRSHKVLVVMLVCITLRSGIRDVFENRDASRVVSLVVGVAAVIATLVLIRMLRARDVVDTTESESGIEGRIQPLKLS